MRAVVMPERALAIQQLAASFKTGAPRPLKAFQKMLGLMASASSVLQLGLLHMRPLQYWLKPRVPPHVWRHGHLRVKVNQAWDAALAPWRNHQWMERGVPLGMFYRRKVVLTDASNLGWGALCDGKPARSPSHQLPGNAGSMFGPSHLYVRPEGAPHLSPLGQYDGGVIYKWPWRSFLEASLHSSRAPLEMGSAQLAFAESNACARQTEPGSRHTISEQCPLRRVDAPPTNGSGNLGNLRQCRGRPLRLRRQHSLPNLSFEGQWCVGPRLAQPPPLSSPPRSPWSHR